MGHRIITIDGAVVITDGILLQDFSFPQEGLVAWYDAADVSSITSSNNIVSQWNDKSGNDYHAIQERGGATTLTSTLGGRNILNFDHACMRLPAATIPTGNSNYTILMVWQADRIQTGINFDSGSNIHQMGLYMSSNNDLQTFGHCEGNNNQSLVAHVGEYISNTPLLATTSYNGVDRILRYSGEFHSGAFEVTEECILQDTGTVNSSLGGAIANSLYDITGFIAEVIIYHRALSASEIQHAEGYLTSKWGLVY